MARYYTNRISWTDYCDIGDALEAARRRAREVMDKLDVIINPNLARDQDTQSQKKRIWMIVKRRSGKKQMRQRRCQGKRNQNGDR